METILMKEAQNWAGERYLAFKKESSGKLVGEVDYRNGKYHIFYGTGWPVLIAVYADRDRAITHLQKAIKAGVQGPVMFRWN